MREMSLNLYELGWLKKLKSYDQIHNEEPVNSMTSQCLTVFYDGGCGLCRREIEHYRNLRASMPIDWVDVTRDQGSLLANHIGLANALAEFHVLDIEGRVHKGADGFLLLWSALPYYRVLPLLCRWLHVQPWLRKLYAHFARWHFRRRCADGACSIDSR
jgi:predicted DCC family thiol-disulfide oxidoreductase YuxK